MPPEPLSGKPVRVPPGRIEIRFRPEHWQAYRTLYARSGTDTGGLPALRERDFDGRAVRVTPRQLEALNAAFASLAAEEPAPNAFGRQEAGRTRLFKRLQFLS